MPFLDLNVNEIVKLSVLDDGTEALLRVSEVNVVPIKSRMAEVDDGDFPQQLEISLEILTPPDARSIIHRIQLPHKSDSEAAKRTKYSMIADFMEAFGLPRDQLSTESWIGAECWAVLRKEEDPVYGDRNTVRRWIGKR